MRKRWAPGVELRAARAILIDDGGRLVLLRRTKPGRAPYWTTPGGRVEDTDGSIEAALHRELAEELGAQATVVSQVFLASFPTETGVAVHHFFAVRLDGIDISNRHGPEFADPDCGSYEVERVDLRGDGLAALDLTPPAVKEFILVNREALLAKAASAG